MQSHKLCVKFFLSDDSAIPHGVIVPVFHSWIQLHAIADHLAIDVADYEHVHNGPGVVLVTHEANFSLETVGGRPGLLYQRKQPLTGSLEERIKAVIGYAQAACERLESDPRLEGKMKFRRDGFLFRIADRLNAPNTAGTFEALRPALEAAAKEVLGMAAKLEHREDSQHLFEVLVRF